MPTITTTYVIGNGNNGAGANQIVSETTSGVTTAYAYDGNGNRTGKQIQKTTTYAYDLSGKIAENGQPEVGIVLRTLGNGMLSNVKHIITSNRSRNNLIVHSRLPRHIIKTKLVAPGVIFNFFPPCFVKGLNCARMSA